MKYVLNQQIVLSEDMKYNATSKAREDVNRTFRDCGFKVVEMTYVQNKRFPYLTYFRILIDLLVFAIRIGKKHDIYLQYPINQHPRNLKLFSKLLHLRDNRLIIIVHDIQGIRDKNDAWLQHEIAFLNTTDKVICHTPAMEEKLKQWGLATATDILYLFDYYVNEKTYRVPTLEKDVVVFAGNLIKSKFISQLIQTPFKYIKFRYYGMPELEITDEKCHEYCGRFTPDNVSYIKGGWGLVWDGDALGTCSGEKGDYLRYNSSHKISLYLAAGIPLIVWEHSSLAKWIKDKNIGICIQNISELESSIQSISDDEYRIMANNVLGISKELRNGIFLKKHIM